MFDICIDGIISVETINQIYKMYLSTSKNKKSHDDL